MQEKTLLKISLIATLVGLIFLFFYSKMVDLAVTESVDATQVEETVKVRGTISKLSQQEKVIFLEILTEQEETVTALLFTEEEVYLQVGDYVEVIGEVEEYQGRKEILSNQVRLI